jgi:hypothetical protein
MEAYDPLKPLDIKLQGRDFERALVPEGQHPLQITGAEATPNKAGTNTNVHLTSTVVNPTPTTKADVTAQPGDRVFQTWDGIYQTEDQEKKGMEPLEVIARIVDAIFGTDKDNRPDLNTDTLNQMVGKQFLGVIRHENDPQFGMQDRLVNYLPLQPTA